MWIASKLEERQRSLTEIVGHWIAARDKTNLPSPESDVSLLSL